MTATRKATRASRVASVNAGSLCGCAPPRAKRGGSIAPAVSVWRAWVADPATCLAATDSGEMPAVRRSRARCLAAADAPNGGAAGPLPIMHPWHARHHSGLNVAAVPVRDHGHGLSHRRGRWLRHSEPATWAALPLPCIPGVHGWQPCRSIGIAGRLPIPIIRRHVRRHEPTSRPRADPRTTEVADARAPRTSISPVTIPRTCEADGDPSASSTMRDGSSDTEGETCALRRPSPLPSRCSCPCPSRSAPRAIPSGRLATTTSPRCTGPCGRSRPSIRASSGCSRSGAPPRDAPSGRPRSATTWASTRASPRSCSTGSITRASTSRARWRCTCSGC